MFAVICALLKVNYGRQIIYFKNKNIWNNMNHWALYLIKDKRAFTFCDFILCITLEKLGGNNGENRKQ